MLCELDVLDLESIESALQEGIDRFGKLDVVLNNAGYGLMGNLESIPRENIQRQYAVNVQGVIDVMQKTLPHFRKNKDGMFINITSIGGRLTFPFMAMYHGTKFALEGISESLRYELAAIGVKIKLVEPGRVATDFGSRSLDYNYNDNLSEYNEYAEITRAKTMEGFQKLGEPSTAEHIAEIIYTAATDGTDTLRYKAGKDAEFILSERETKTDKEFFEMFHKIMGY